MNTSSPYAFIFEFDLADRLRKTLRTRDISVQAMADHLGVTRNSVGAWMSGKRVPGRTTLRVWAAYVDAPLHWLETGVVPELGAEQG